MSGKYTSPSVSEESTYLSEWLIHWGNASCISCIYMCIGLGQGDMTEAEGFGVAVRAYYYAVITTIRTHDRSWTQVNEAEVEYHDNDPHHLATMLPNILRGETIYPPQYTGVNSDANMLSDIEHQKA